MMATDIKGLGVSTKSADALAAYERGLDLFLRWRTGSVEALDAAAQSDPRFALAYCTKAYIAWRMGRADLATAASRQATAVADDARHERERLHVQAVDALQRGDHPATYEVLGQIASRYPTDRIAVRIIGLNCITQGDYRGGIDIARRSLEANPDEPQYQTMLGFFLEQSGYNDEGLAVSLRSLAQDPTSLYTYHAVGHAYQARGDYRNALETFERAASLERYPHLLWHLAEIPGVYVPSLFRPRYGADRTLAALEPLKPGYELAPKLLALRHRQRHLLLPAAGPYSISLVRSRAP